MSEQVKVKVNIVASTGDTIYPGGYVPKTHIFGNIKIKKNPQLANAKLEHEVPEGEKVVVSGLSYQVNKKNYPLFKEYGILCIYQNGWLTPILRESEGYEKETMKKNIFISPYHPTHKIGPEMIWWPIVEEVVRSVPDQKQT